MATIYHIAFPRDWKEAKLRGEYRISTKGKSLDDEGFIHAGTARQVAPVANIVYRENSDLLVLVIDVDRLDSEIRYDEVPGWTDPFPHIYGPLNVNAVTGILSLTRESDGKFYFSAPESDS